jgi:DNA-binding beta-propeller fold protein YncE
MSSRLKIRRRSLVAVTTTVMALAGATSAHAAGPVKLVPAGHIGTGEESSLAGGLASPQGVAVSSKNGNVYVADYGNHRIEEFEPNGKFVLMFGKEVDETTKTDLCEAVSGDVCKAGVESIAAGQFVHPQSIAVDPVSGNVDVAEHVEVNVAGETKFGQRVQQFTAGGKFVLEIGGDVNKTKKTNLCTELEVEKEAVECGPPALSESGLPEIEGEHGAFNFLTEQGNVLGTGGPEDLIYVGEAHRVQEFEADGVWHGEIPVGGEVAGVGVEQASGNVYVIENFNTTVGEFDPTGKELERFAVMPREQNGSITRLEGVAVDSKAHLAITAKEEVGAQHIQFGSLYMTAAGHALISEFTIPARVNVRGIAFDKNGEKMYGAAEGGEEVLSYASLPVGELTTGPVACKPGPEKESNATFECAMSGEVNPYNIASTEVAFAFGRTCALGSVTPKQSEPTEEKSLPVSAVEDFRPNASFCYRLTGNDANVLPPETLTGAKRTESLPAVPPKVIGTPSALVGSPSSAVMFGELNPENASTEYYFEYALVEGPGKEPLAACPGGLIKKEACPGVLASSVLNSALYGKTGAAIETSGLQPSTTYQFRLAASNEAGSVVGETQQFTTLPSPKVLAQTGGFSGVTATSAVISGFVNGDGKPGTYSFQVGVFNPAGTQLGTVLTGSTGGESEGKALMLTGLQPGTTYAYRIVIQSGYGTAEGEIRTFVTQGSPAVIPVPLAPVQLATPPIAFPKPSPPPHKKVTRKKGKGKKHKGKKRSLRKKA